MDIDELDEILLDDYETFNTNDNQGRKTEFDPLAPSLSSADGHNAALPITKRRRFKKLDAELLLSSKGLPRIRKQTPLIKFYGKGNEVADLRKLMDYYQMWAHNLYPRLQFRDFARNVLKATANPKVIQELRTWQDEHREKTDERARMLAELEGEKDPFTDTHSSQQTDKDDDDDDEAMNEVFMDYLVGVKQGTISIEDAPTPSIVPNRPKTNPSQSPLDKSNHDDDDDDDELFTNFVTNVNRSSPTSNTVTPATNATTALPASNSPSSTTSAQALTQKDDKMHESTDDEDTPLFLHLSQKKRRKIQVEDEDMSE
ncbi:replication fork protection component Swi3-domain-containing protein [Dichotomocladium elegans]|nr:replication fork protection component Swi3-domain-containing protein [Dichotomocladium elegans]